MRLKVLGGVGAVAAVLLMSAVALAVFPTQGVGQGNSDIWVMNLNETQDASVVASYINQSGSQDSSVGGAIDALGNTSFPASSSGLGNDWLGSMVLYSDRELASAAELFWRNVPAGDGWSAAAYSGYSEGDTGLFFPGVAKTLYHRTLVTIQCVDTTECSVSMTYRSVDGSVVSGSPFLDTIEPDSQETYDLWDATLNPSIPTGLPVTWYGSLQVTSGQEIAGVMVVHWNKGYAAGYNAIIPGSDTEIYFPAVNRRNFTGDWMGQSDWQGLTVQNLNNFTITVYLSFYDVGDVPVLAFTDTIPAYSSDGYNTRYCASWACDTLGDTFVGSATVTSTQPIAGISGLVRVPSEGLAGGYQAVGSGSNRLVYPVVYRIKSGSEWLNYSSLGIVNLDPVDPISVTLKFMNSDGTVGLEFDDNIAANSSNGYSTRYGGATYDPLGTSWAGTLVISTTNPDGILAVVTNQTKGSGYMYLTSNNFIPD